MKHLKSLERINYIYAAILLVVGLVFAILTIGLVGHGVWQAFTGVESASAEVKQSMLAAGISVALWPAAYTIIPIVLLFFLAFLMGLSGKKIGQGRGRLLQTIVAVLAVFTGCIGVLYAGYALWVCWMNKGTVPVFSQAPRSDVTNP